MTSKVITYDQWISELNLVTHRVNIPLVGEGWKRTAELSKEWKRGLSITRKVIKRLLDTGLWEKKCFDILDKNNRIQSIPYYRPKKSK